MLRIPSGAGRCFRCVSLPNAPRGASQAVSCADVKPKCMTVTVPPASCRLSRRRPRRHSSSPGRRPRTVGRMPPVNNRTALAVAHPAAGGTPAGQPARRRRYNYCRTPMKPSSGCGVGAVPPSGAPICGSAGLAVPAGKGRATTCLTGVRFSSFPVLSSVSSSSPLITSYPSRSGRSIQCPPPRLQDRFRSW